MGGFIELGEGGRFHTNIGKWELKSKLWKSKRLTQLLFSSWTIEMTANTNQPYYRGKL